MRARLLLLTILLACAAAPPVADGSTSARVAYERVLARERVLVTRASGSPAPRLVRRLVAEYEEVARRYARTGYADNALWQAAGLAADLHGRTRLASDRRTATRLLNQLVSGYPTSSLVPGARASLKALNAARQPRARTSSVVASTGGAAPPGREASSRTVPEAPILAPEPSLLTRELHAMPAAPARPDTAPAVAKVLNVQRAVMPGLVRVTIELDAEVTFREQRIENPTRVFFDLKGATARESLEDAVLTFPDEAVRQIRLGRRPDQTTRVVMELDGPQHYSVFSLYNPFRIIVDFERHPDAVLAARPATLVSRSVGTSGSADAEPSEVSSRSGGAPPEPIPDAPATLDTPALSATSHPPPALPAPVEPATNSSGSFSLARQLGLGISRIVIDPGHGGHDPGALGKRLSEAAVVLDVALRLEKLLVAQPGVDVVLTRRTDQFVPLEQRTAIANKERADLFLSIHVNASRNRRARGVETYFLNFATNPEAEAVAARENSASGGTMHNLPDIVRAIALNNKVDESRDFARMVQASIVKRVQDRGGKDLGVKQAPFVVLIGAQMPSVLAEIAFITHREEEQLLRTPAHRQKIAEALLDAVLKYQRSLKSVGTVASQ